LAKGDGVKIDGRRILILGATSAIAQQVARLAVERGCPVVLAARNKAHLEAIAVDLRTRGGSPICLEADLSCVEQHTSVLDKAWAGLGGVDFALIAYGLYAERQAAENTDTLVALLQTNFVSTAHLAIRIVDRLVAQGSGRLGVITSVAGDRGRRRNYVYGSAKGGLSVLLQGLDHKLGNGTVGVSDIKLGMADTPMTAHLPASPLKISSERAAAMIIAGLENGHAVVYVPWFWRWIMLVIRLLPRFAMNKLDL
jgi:decaprenylphospho-beta-D-erythro-pentofuranosid-2-ulose 2-reductase